MSQLLPRHLAPAAVLLMSIAACAPRGAADPDATGAHPVVPVRVATLEVRSFHESVAAPGRWRSSGDLVVTAPFAAYVESLRVGLGDGVRGGQTLAVLVTQESRAAIVGAELLVAAAADPAARSEAERALRQARRDLVRVPLTASGSGTVVRNTVAAGALVPEGGELLALVAPEALVFEAHVALRDVARIATGEPARIAMEDGRTLDASVSRRLPQTSPEDQSGLVWLAPARAPTMELLDRFANATILTGAPRRALAVPDAALVEDDLTGEFRIATVGPGGVATWVPVRLGLAEAGWHELMTAALAPGTRAIVSGQRGLPDSTRVSIEP